MEEQTVGLAVHLGWECHKDFLEQVEWNMFN
jgi:hypothetical protein